MDHLHLFNVGNFTLHAGGASDFKIDCDALTDEDLSALAQFIAPKLPKFHTVRGIPTGGMRFAEQMEKYIDSSTGLYELVVDDVLTSGKSLFEEIEPFSSDKRRHGLVIFDRWDQYQETQQESSIYMPSLREFYTSIFRM